MRARITVAACLLLAVVALPARAGQVSPAWTKSLVVVVPGDKTYHVVDCPRVKGVQSPTVMSVTQAQERKLVAHDCRKAIAEAQRNASTNLMVWVDLKTKRYHLAGCSLVGLPRAQMPIGQAMATF